jgi:hypothetical protein
VILITDEVVELIVGADSPRLVRIVFSDGDASNAYFFDGRETLFELLPINLLCVAD